MNKGFLLLFCGIFISRLLCGQDFTTEVKEYQITIDGKAYKGFGTFFDFEPKAVEKGWWSYSRNFGHPLSMKGYNKLTIPSEQNTGNQDIELFSRVSRDKSGALFFITLNDAQIAKEKVANYQSQVKILLNDFKKDYYIKRLEEQLADVDKKAVKISKKVSKQSENARQKLLDELESLRQQSDALHAKLKVVYKAYN